MGARSRLPRAWDTTAAGGERAYDCDGDGFLGTLEAHVGTHPQAFCSADSIAYNEEPDAWPTDLSDDRAVTGADLSLIAADIGKGVPPAVVRKDIAPGLAGDNAITGADLSRVAGVIGRGCTPPLARSRQCNSRIIPNQKYRNYQTNFANLRCALYGVFVTNVDQ